MNTQSTQYKAAIKEGEFYIGKKAQSRLLTELTISGKQVLCQPSLITGYEIVENFKEPTVMVFIDDKSIFSDLLINIH